MKRIPLCEYDMTGKRLVFFEGYDYTVGAIVDDAAVEDGHLLAKDSDYSGEVELINVHASFGVDNTDAVHNCYPKQVKEDVVGRRKAEVVEYIRGLPIVDRANIIAELLR